MKKIILAMLALFVFSAANSQVTNSELSKGNWFLEANTGFGENVGSTSFYFKTKDGNTSFNIGAEGGYFLKDKLALKLGLGYGENESSISNDPIAYKIGLKYYWLSKVPFEISYNGVGFGDSNANPNYLGFQAGYAWFISNKVSIEPGLRYNSSLNKQYFDSSFQFNVGFVVHL